MEIPFISNYLKRLATRRAARSRLAVMALAVQSGPFSVKFNARHLQRRFNGPKPRRQMCYERLNHGERKEVQSLLKIAYDGLNRAERRQLARRHGWTFLEGVGGS